MAALTLSQALAAQRGEEEEEGADHPGCLRHAGLWEGCSVVLGQSCRLLGSAPLGCFYGGEAGLASPRASSYVGAGGGPGPLPRPKAQRVNNTHPLPAQPWEERNLLLGCAFGP